MWHKYSKITHTAHKIAFRNRHDVHAFGPISSYVMCASDWACVSVYVCVCVWREWVRGKQLTHTQIYWLLICKNWLFTRSTVDNVTKDFDNFRCFFFGEMWRKIALESHTFNVRRDANRSIIINIFSLSIHKSIPFFLTLSSTMILEYMFEWERSPHWNVFIQILVKDYARHGTPLKFDWKNDYEDRSLSLSQNDFYWWHSSIWKAE